MSDETKRQTDDPDTVHEQTKDGTRRCQGCGQRWPCAAVWKALRTVSFDMTLAKE